MALVVKNPPASAGDIGDMGSVLRVRRSSGGGHKNPLQYPYLENPQGKRSLVGCSPWRCKESDTTEQLSIAQCTWVLSCVQLFVAPWTVACQAPLSIGFSRQDYWSGLPYPSLGDLPNPGIEPTSPMSPALAGGFLTTSTTWQAMV